MRYRYEFYKGSREDTVSTISTDAPLPHIQVGNDLDLETSEISTIAGHCWEIQGVEVYLFAPGEGELQKVAVRVMIRERVRTPER
jgi:hypothetical protein